MGSPDLFQALTKDPTNGQQSSPAPSDIQLTPYLSVVVAILYMMAVDGVISERESSQLQSVIGADTATVRRAVAFAESHDVEVFLQLAPPLLDAKEKLCLLLNVCDSLMADGELQTCELQLFDRLLVAFGHTRVSFQPYFDAIAHKGKTSVFGDFDAEAPTESLSPPMTLVVSMLYMMSVDGSMSEEEVGRLHAAIGMSQKLLRASLSYMSKVRVPQFLSVAAEMLNERQRVCLLLNVCDSMMSDRQVVKSEESLFRRMLAAFGKQAKDFERYLNILHLKNDIPAENRRRPSAPSQQNFSRSTRSDRGEGVVFERKQHWEEETGKPGEAAGSADTTAPSNRKPGHPPSALATKIEQTLQDNVGRLAEEVDQSIGLEAIGQNAREDQAESSEPQGRSRRRGAGAQSDDGKTPAKARERQGAHGRGHAPAQQGGPAAGNAHRDQRDGPQSATTYHDQQGGPSSVKGLQDQRDGAQSSSNYRDQRDGPSSVKGLQDQRDGAQSSDNTRDQRDGPSSAKGLQDQRDGAQSSDNYRDQRDGPSSAKGLQDQRDGAQSSSNYRDQRDGPSSAKGLQDQRDGAQSSDHTRDQQDGPHTAENYRDQQAGPSSAQGYRDQQDGPQTTSAHRDQDGELQPGRHWKDADVPAGGRGLSDAAGSRGSRVLQDDGMPDDLAATSAEGAIAGQPHAVRMDAVKERTRTIHDYLDPLEAATSIAKASRLPVLPPSPPARPMIAALKAKGQLTAVQEVVVQEAAAQEALMQAINPHALNRPDVDVQPERGAAQVSVTTDAANDDLAPLLAADTGGPIMSHSPTTPHPTTAADKQNRRLRAWSAVVLPALFLTYGSTMVGETVSGHTFITQENLATDARIVHQMTSVQQAVYRLAPEALTLSPAQMLPGVLPVAGTALAGSAIAQASDPEAGLSDQEKADRFLEQQKRALEVTLQHHQSASAVAAARQQWFVYAKAIVLLGLGLAFWGVLFRSMRMLHVSGAAGIAGLLLTVNGHWLLVTI